MAYEKDLTWWGQRRWNMAFNEITKADRLVAKAVKDGHEAIEAGTIEADLEKFSDSSDAEFELVDTPAAVIRSGLFCQAVSEFEYALLFLCIDGSRVITRREYEWRKVRQSIVHSRLKFIGELIGRDALGESEVQELQAIRNLITHTAGETFSLETNRRDAVEAHLAKWAEAHPRIATVNIAGVMLHAPFLNYALAHYDSVMAGIVRDLSAKADLAIAARAQLT